jgi:hypothetical protein
MNLAATVGWRIPHTAHVCDAGPSWSDRTIDLGKWTAIAYGNGVFIAGGFNSTLSQSEISISYDNGNTWQTKSSPFIFSSQYRVQPFGLAYGNGIWVAFGNSIQEAVSDDDGATWSLVATPSADKTYLKFMDGQFYWVAVNNANLYRSLDGQSWNAQNIGIGEWSVCAFGGGVAIILAETQCVVSSDHGVTWAPGGTPGAGLDGFYDLTYGNGTFVATYNNTNARVLYSKDGGQTWALSNPLPDTFFYYRLIIFRQGVFLAFAFGGDRAAVSVDGINWAVAEAISTYGNSTVWSVAADNKGHYVAVSTILGAGNESPAAAVGIC